jgi:hypothetical protein
VASQAWDGFCLLSRRRAYGMGGPQPIALVDVAALFDVWAVEPTERRSLLNLIDELDNAWLAEQQKETKDKTDDHGDAQPPARPAPRKSGGPKGRRAR